ncbi:Hypothetical predicted protein [Mytilus galloprovincialis]|uniref:MAM domain-containing protein n=1 Tax=Mytilus galloprovincialis TaxID=29158 RepID=A0A8B6FA77_MYTGA|nr:Hypothetical predicted protein [Mytilus galloprovincialis]
MTNILIFFCLWISLANTEKHSVTVPFNKTIPILCTGNTVIKLLNISVEENSKCAPVNCRLSEQEHFRTRNKCNGQRSCNITSNMPNSCLLELGFFSLSYSCLEIAHNCNFENSLCGWISSSKSNGLYIWKKGSGSTKTKLTGPSKDHTYVYFISQCRSNADACKGTTNHLKSCQHVNGTYQLAECSNIYMNIDKSSLRFDPEFISTACSAIYQQINDSLCTNVSNWDLCTIDISTFVQNYPECFKRYTMKAEYECEDPQETVMNSSKFTEPVLTSQSETTPTLFDITTAQKTSEQLETTYLHLQTTDKSQTTIALIPLTSDNLDVTESGTSKSKSQKIVDPSIFAGLGVGAALCFGILIGLIILYCKRRSNKGKLGDDTKHSSDNAIHRKTDLPQTNNNITNKVSTETDPDYQHYYEIKDIKRLPLKVQAENDLADNQEYSIIDQNNTTKERHETTRPLNHSDYDIIVENLQSKKDNKTTDKNNKTTSLHGGDNYYTFIDPHTFEQNNEYDVLSSHNEISHPSLPEISSFANYVVLDPMETGFNRSTDQLCQDCKEDPIKFENSSRLNINGNELRLTSATSTTNVAMNSTVKGFSRTKRLTL